jgi:hypothetical protein
MKADERFKFQAWHAMAVVKVIARHLKMRFRLRSVERGGGGYRIDLLFEASSGRTRLVEVKSSKSIREVHRLQAALYPHIHADEVTVSNANVDEILGAEFIQEARSRAEVTRQFLTNNPELAAINYTPHRDCCYTCGNSRCPFVSELRNERRVTEIVAKSRQLEIIAKGDQVRRAGLELPGV